MLLLLATCLLVSVGALWVEANDDTVGATRSVGWGDAGLNANDGVAVRTKARAAAEIPADLMVPREMGNCKCRHNGTTEDDQTTLMLRTYVHVGQGTERHNSQTKAEH